MRRLIAWGLLALLLAAALPPPVAAQCLAHSFVSGKPDGVDASLVRPSDWNDCHLLSGGTNGQVIQRDTGAADGWSFVNQPDIFGPSYLTLTNKTGGTLSVNDVVAVDTTNDSAVALGDTASSLQTYVVAAESISNNVAGKFYHRGLVSVKVTGAVTRGRYLVKSATTLAAEDSGTLMTSVALPPAGAFAVATTAAAGPGAGTVTAVLLGATLPQVAASALPGASYFEAQEASAPATPSAGRVRLYVPTETPAMNRWEAKDATGQTLAFSGVLYRAAGNPFANVVSTATETSIAAPTIKGGTLGTDRALRITILGDWLANTGVGTTWPTVRIKVGATTALTLQPASNINSATRVGWRVEAILAARGATNAQAASGRMHANATIAGVSGTNIAPTNLIHDAYSTHSSVAEDSTADKTLDITIQNSTSHASYSTQVFSVLVEWL